MVPCLPGHLPAEFMSLWSLGFPGLLTLHSLLCIPICLPGLLYLLCLVLVPLLCLPVHRWSPGLTRMAITCLHDLLWLYMHS